MKNKLLSLLLSTVVVFSSLPVSAFAADPFGIAVDEQEHTHEHTQQHTQLFEIANLQGLSLSCEDNSCIDAHAAVSTEDHNHEEMCENCEDCSGGDDCENCNDCTDTQACAGCDEIEASHAIEAVDDGIMTVGSMTGTCPRCGPTTASYVYSAINDSYHSVVTACDSCGYDLAGGVGGRQSHSFSGNTCKQCGYTKSCSHTSTTLSYITGCDWQRVCNSCGAVTSTGTTHGPYTYGSWKYYSATKHRRSYTCSYGDSGTYYETANHSTVAQYSQHNDSQHAVSQYCETCSTTISTSYEDHSFTYGEWTSDSDNQHKREISCSCGYSSTEYGDHVDGDNDGSCDSCGHSMTFFSVTVPTFMSLAVSESGKVYAADNVVIVNNSSSSVEITGIKLDASGDWSIVPYDYNMASAKVDSHLIGFSLGSSKTSIIGQSEQLSLSDDWSIGKGSSLSLEYDAVVSATSSAFSDEQVLTATFVLDWAS